MSESTPRTGDYSSPVAPADGHNARWMEYVAPSHYTNPTPRGPYDLVVIGAGPGGLVAAAGAAGLGAKVALIERHLMGGDCLNVGCVPSKSLVHAAQAWHTARRAIELEDPIAEGAGRFETAMARLREVRAGLSHHDSVERFSGLGIDVFLGHGRFVAARSIEVRGARLAFKRAVIATGARAAVPSIPGLTEAGYLTNETVFNVTRRPSSLLVIGAGPIGCELGQAFARFGARVAIVGTGPEILPRDDRDAAAVVRRSLENDGVTLHLGTRVVRIEPGAAQHRAVLASGAAVECEAILVAAGRAPNVEDLGLEAAGIEGRPSGIAVDDRLRTANRRVFAIGDCSSPHKFTHAADGQARLVIANALFKGRGRASSLIVPWATFTSPELAHVGLDQEQLAARGAGVTAYTTPLRATDRGAIEGEEGFVRVHVASGTDRIVAATVVGARAGDLIGELGLAMRAGVGLKTISGTIHAYPTTSEAIRRTGDAFNKTRLTPFARRILGLLLRLLR